MRPLCILSSFLLVAPLLAEPPAKEITVFESRAVALVDAMAKKDLAGASRHFDEAMQKALPPEKLEAVWKSLTDKLGSFKKHSAIRTERAGKYELVYVTCEFEKGSLDARVVFSADQHIGGLFFVPPKASAPYQPPAYVRPDAFRDLEVRVGSGEWSLPATLTLPKGDGPFPAVVLVHGSGPQDRDETILVNKPFRDLAWGLGSRGIAVLRYEKRTKEHAGKLAGKKDRITLREEVIDDAALAIALLRKTDKVKPRQVFVLGHSLGAMLAPSIATSAPDVAGLIFLAGNTRPLEDLIVDQVAYVLTKDGLTDDGKKQLDKIKEQAARAKDPKLSADTPADKLPLGIPASYWLDLRKHDPVVTVPKASRPMFILQGERDYQVTMADFNGWKKLLEKRADVTFKSYPGLNHLFMQGKGKSSPEEYEKVGHVDSEVIEDLARWLKRGPKAD